MSVIWKVQDGPGRSWVFKLQQDGKNAIIHTFRTGGYFNLEAIRRHGEFGIHDISLNRTLIYIDQPSNSIVYSPVEGGNSYLKLDPASINSLKAYITEISIEPTTPDFGRVNKLKVARYSSADDVLHVTHDEDPMRPVRNEDEPSNISVRDPTQGGRRSTRKNRRRRLNKRFK